MHPTDVPASLSGEERHRLGVWTSWQGAAGGKEGCHQMVQSIGNRLLGKGSMSDCVADCGFVLKSGETTR